MGEVLALAARAEVERLREECDSLSGQLDHMRQRLRAAQQEAAAAPRLPPMPSAASAAALQGAAASGPLPAATSERVVLRLEFPTAPADSEEAQVTAVLEVQPAAGPGEAAAATPLAALLQQLADASAAPAGAPAMPLEPALLLQAHAGLSLLAGRQGVALPGAGAAESGGADGAGSSGLAERCAALEGSNARLAGELTTAQQEIAFLKEAAERTVQVGGRLGGRRLGGASRCRARQRERGSGAYLCQVAFPQGKCVGAAPVWVARKARACRRPSFGPPPCCTAAPAGGARPVCVVAAASVGAVAGGAGRAAGGGGAPRGGGAARAAGRGARGAARLRHSGPAGEGLGRGAGAGLLPLQRAGAGAFLARTAADSVCLEAGASGERFCIWSIAYQQQGKGAAWCQAPARPRRRR